MHRRINPGRRLLAALAMTIGMLMAMMLAQALAASPSAQAQELCGGVPLPEGDGCGCPAATEICDSFPLLPMPDPDPDPAPDPAPAPAPEPSPTPAPAPDPDPAPAPAPDPAPAPAPDPAPAPQLPPPVFPPMPTPAPDPEPAPAPQPAPAPAPAPAPQPMSPTGNSTQQTSNSIKQRSTMTNVVYADGAQYSGAYHSAYSDYYYLSAYYPDYIERLLGHALLYSGRI